MADLPDISLRVRSPKVSNWVSWKPLKIRRLGGLGRCLGDGLWYVVAGYGLAREGVRELGPGQQLGDGGQLLEVFVVTLD